MMSPREELRRKLAELVGDEAAERVMTLFTMVTTDVRALDVTTFADLPGSVEHVTRWVVAWWPTSGSRRRVVVTDEPIEVAGVPIEVVGAIREIPRRRRRWCASPREAT